MKRIRIKSKAAFIAIYGRNWRDHKLCDFPEEMDYLLGKLVLARVLNSGWGTYKFEIDHYNDEYGEGHYWLISKQMLYSPKDKSYEMTNRLFTLGKRKRHATTRKKENKNSY